MQKNTLLLRWKNQKLLKPLLHFDKKMNLEPSTIIVGKEIKSS